MSVDLLRRAAKALRNGTPMSPQAIDTLADLLDAADFEAGAETGTNPEALAVARAVLREES